MSDLSTSMVISFNQGAIPASYSSYLSNAPSGAQLTCSPSLSTLTAFETLTWYATAMGCPNGFEYSKAANVDTCIYTSSKYLDIHWGCDFVIPFAITSTVDRGAINFIARAVTTKTEYTDSVTVTQNAQMLSTLNPIVQTESPSTSVTATAQKRQHAMIVRFEPRNLTARRSSFQCSQNDYFCPTGTACVGDAFGHTCCGTQTLICVPYNAEDIFQQDKEKVNFQTWSSTIVEYLTTYSTANEPSSTVTVTRTRTYIPTITNTGIAIVPGRAADTSLGSSSTHRPDNHANPNSDSTVKSGPNSSSSSSSSSTSFSPTTSTYKSAIKLTVGITVSLGLTAISGFTFLFYRNWKTLQSQIHHAQLVERPTFVAYDRDRNWRHNDERMRSDMLVLPPTVRAVRKSEGYLPANREEGMSGHGYENGDRDEYGSAYKTMLY